MAIRRSLGDWKPFQSCLSEKPPNLVELTPLSNQNSADEIYVPVSKFSHSYTLNNTFNLGFLGMQTARNIFIATLAVADSALCLLTMPMTLIGVLTKYWPFGPNTWILCKIVRTSPPITVFFSSYTMAFIAIDRHRVIVHSTKRQVHQVFSSCICEL